MMWVVKGAITACWRLTDPEAWCWALWLVMSVICFYTCAVFLWFAGTVYSQAARLSPTIKGTPSVTIMCIDFGRKYPSDWRLKCLIPLCACAKLCIGNLFQPGLLRCHGHFCLLHSLPSLHWVFKLCFLALALSESSQYLFFEVITNNSILKSLKSVVFQQIFTLFHKQIAVFS